MRAEALSTEALRALFARAYGGRPEARLRPEEERKSRVLPGVLHEALRLLSPRGTPVVVDAASGRAPFSLALAAACVERGVGIIAIDREAPYGEAAQRAFARLKESTAATSTLETRTGDVGDASLWPAQPDLVVSIHACGSASDLVLERASHAGAKHILVMPCCVSASVRSAARADQAAHALAFEGGLTQKRFRDVYTLNERRLVLEASGYKTDVVALCAESATPYNLALRGARMHEPVRMERARRALETLALQGVREAEATLR